MIGRHRGEHHTQGIWQPRRTDSNDRSPSPGATAAVAQRSAAATVKDLIHGAAGDLIATRRSRTRHKYLKLALMLVIAAAIIAGRTMLTTGHPVASLPGTPPQWLDAYEAAAIDNPGRVCTQLFAPQLAAAYPAKAHMSCREYFARITSTSLRIKRILQDRDTAVLELHQTIERTDWSVILQHHDDGWRAIDLIPGRPLR
jgi:hypothetical protein